MARLCAGVKGDGTACRRPPSKDRPVCLAHDPQRLDEHAALSKQGGHMRHDGEALSLKDEVRALIADVRSGVVSPGAGNVMATLYRLLRDITVEDARQAGASDTLVESIFALRAANPPDLSEPANGGGGGVDDMSGSTPPEPYDPDAPRMEDYRRTDGSLDGEAYIRASHAHKATPLGHLSVAERRARWQSGQRSGA